MTALEELPHGDPFALDLYCSLTSPGGAIPIATNTEEPQSLPLEGLRNWTSAPKSAVGLLICRHFCPVPSSYPSRYSPFSVSHVKQNRSGRHHA